jgi:hypothetical protein
MKPPKSRFKQRARTGVVRTDRAEGYDPDALKYVAIHEAGHAVSAIVLGIDLNSVDIKRRRLPGVISVGFTSTKRLSLGDVAGKGEGVALPHVIQSFTGPIAESMVNPFVCEFGGDEKDRADARLIAAAAICEVTTMPDGSRGVTPDELERHRPRLEALFDSAVSAAYDLVVEYWPAIETVAALLVDREQLSRDEVAAIVDGSRADPAATRAAVEP